MLILEIGLIIWVWKRGWKAWALLPIGLQFAIGVVVGFLVALSGKGHEEAEVLFTLAQHVSLLALVQMAANGRTVRDHDEDVEEPDSDYSRHMSHNPES